MGREEEGNGRGKEEKEKFATVRPPTMERDHHLCYFMQQLLVDCCMVLLSDRCIWRTVDKLFKSDGDPSAMSDTGEDDDEDESDLWNWYIS